MTHTLMKLPFEETALEPIISGETLAYHYGKHHATYVNNLNTLIKGTSYEGLSLEEIVKTADGGIFNNAAQVYNHDFYFTGMSGEATAPSDALIKALEAQFESVDAFKEAFLGTAAKLFGSGWVWLCRDNDGKLLIKSYSNADNPLLDGLTPLMTCDVWEHAYYIDYRNARPAYLEKWWELINWNFVSDNFAS